jgi:single-strand DNA-binding protein
MASDQNEINVIGNLTRDPEIRYTQSGTPMCLYSIANNRYRKNGDDWQKETSFFDCQSYGETAEIVKRFGKGKKIQVSGRLKQDRWQDKTTGQNRSAIKIIGEKVVEIFDERDPYEASTPEQAHGETKINW